MDKKQILQVSVWIVSIVSALLACLAWLQTYGWDIPKWSSYAFFPLFGLLAFSLMWSHYIASVTRQILGIDKAVLKTYLEVTSVAVLFALLMHPGLLVWQLWRDGNGLPPRSVYDFVAPGLAWVSTLGVVSLWVFLAYELRRLFEKKSWWKYVSYASDIAMLLIFYHGLRLGSQLVDGWFRIVWIFYGVTLLLSLLYIHSKKVRQAISSVKIT